jgi:dipeptidyl aminopeptidase/acylaminoacyl peptidase
MGNKTVFPEKKTFTNDLGLEVEYWVMKPTNYKQGENIHYY